MSSSFVMARKPQFWTEQDQEAVDATQWFDELVAVSLQVIERIPGQVHQLCGPISTGGLGCIHKNRRVFEFGIAKLEAQGLHVFNQLPVETAFIRFYDRWVREGGTGYFMPCLEEFYRPLFRSGRIHCTHFMPGFRASFGTTWEFNEVDVLGIQKVELPPEWLISVHAAAGF